jgi:dihydrofolate reductase
MTTVRVNSVGVSIDGYSAGPRQSLEHPLGVGGERMMEWFFPTRTFQQLYGDTPGETGIDNDIAERGMSGIGAWILGRNMFGPIRGPWPDEEWKGWWGDEPPYHVPTFVLTHHARSPITMKGGTAFHFVTDGIHSALEQARKAAGEKDIRIGGGAATIRQYLKAGLIDEMVLAQGAALLGSGESIFEGIDMHALGYECVERIVGERATHLIIRRKAG